MPRGRCPTGTVLTATSFLPSTIVIVLSFSFET